MKKEYPTTLEEVLAIGENKSCFAKDSLDKQEQNIIPGSPYRLVTDTLTGKQELQKTDESPITMFKPPIMGHKYMITCDPIGSNSDDSDYFAASVWGLANNEQVATVWARGLLMEDFADLIMGVSSIYNRAIVCPELNMSEGLQACLRAKGFYNFYYTDKQRKAKKEAGIRTTVSSKPAMLDRLQLMLDRGSIIIRSAETLRQLRRYERRVKHRSAGGSTVTFSAPKGDYDDMVSTCFIYAGTKNDRELVGNTSVGFTIL